MIPPVNLHKCYRIAGRTPIVVTLISYGTGKRIEVAGYTRSDYAENMKFFIYDPKTQQTIADMENTKRPQPRRFRFNSKSKVIEVPFEHPKTTLAMSPAEMKKHLAKPRKGL